MICLVCLWQGFALGLNVKCPTLGRCLKVQYPINRYLCWNRTQNDYACTINDWSSLIEGQQNSHTNYTRIWVRILEAVPEAYKDLLRSKYTSYQVYSGKLLSNQHIFAAPLSRPPYQQTCYDIPSILLATSRASLPHLITMHGCHRASRVVKLHCWLQAWIA